MLNMTKGILDYKKDVSKKYSIPYEKIRIDQSLDPTAIFFYNDRGQKRRFGVFGKRVEEL